eukprot:PhF_6_TR13009/c0_g1_i1/m.20615
MRFLFVTVEFLDPIFSGNGTYGRSIVNGCSKLGHQIHVVCCVPNATTVTSSSYVVPPNCTIASVTVDASLWKRADRSGPWKQFELKVAEGLMSSGLDCGDEDGVGYDVLFFVDWSAFGAAQALRGHLGSTRVKRCVYLNFRVFSRMVGLPAEDFDFYNTMEAQCVQWSHRSVALCWSDAAWLQKLLFSNNTSNSSEEEKKNCCTAVPCPLRYDIQMKALSNPDVSYSQRTKRYVICCVRRCEEKNVMFFVNVMKLVVEGLAGSGAVVTPVLCGAIIDEKYNLMCVEHLMAAIPNSIVINTFLSSDQLSELFSEGIVNFHPPLYEAFGLTMLEAAAFGCPSVCHYEKDLGVNQPVGVCGLLQPDRDEIVGVDYRQGDVVVAEEVRKLMLDPLVWERKSKAAKTRSTMWTEEGCAAQLV